MEKYHFKEDDRQHGAHGEEHCDHHHDRAHGQVAADLGESRNPAAVKQNESSVTAAIL